MEKEKRCEKAEKRKGRGKKKHTSGRGKGARVLRGRVTRKGLMSAFRMNR